MHETPAEQSPKRRTEHLSRGKHEELYGSTLPAGNHLGQKISLLYPCALFRIWPRQGIHILQLYLYLLVEFRIVRLVQLDHRALRWRLLAVP